MKQPSAISTLFALIIGLFFLTFSQTIAAQSALDGFNPNANGTIRTFAIQADGKILIGGEFTTVSGVARNRIARLNADGTLDMTFDPNANNSVFSMAVQSDGKILAGGNFTSVSPNGGATVTRNNIARFNPDGTLDTTFDPNSNGEFFSIVVQSDGKILMGGNFTSVAPNGGATVTRNYIARFNANGTLDTAFDPNASGLVYSIAVQSNGKILIGGDFSSITPNGGAGFIRNRIARLNIDGTLDTVFNPNSSGGILSIAVQADGKVLAGGQFISIGGQPRNNIARLDAVTGLADSFDPSTDEIVWSIVVQSDGKILAGGSFTSVAPNGGATVIRNHIARFNLDGTLDTPFNPNVDNQVDSMAVQSDGKILVGGKFNTIGGQPRNRIARLERDGTLDQTLNLSTIGSFVLAIAVQTNGKVLIGGTFSNVLGVARNNIARLNADGTLDTAFNPNANNIIDSIAVQADGQILTSGQFTNIGGQTRNRIARLNSVTGAADSFDPDANNFVVAIAVQPDGKILVGGFFTNIGGQTRNRIARLDPVTGLADSFDPNANNIVLSIATQSDGKILAAGFFTNIGGQTRNRIARLNSDGTPDLGFNPNANSQVYSIAVQSDGKVIAGGIFTNIGGQPRNRIARLEATTGAADSFDPNANNVVWSIAVQADGKVLAGGAFTNIGGQPRNRLARLDGTTNLADSFNPNVDNEVDSIAVLADGKILVGGQFTNIGGQSRSLFARLSNDTAALSTLAVTQTTLTLTRDGSGAQFARVIFEQSTDNGANWTLLGTATNSLTDCGLWIADCGLQNKIPFAPNAAGYTLAGQNIPTGQNVLIRARGFYRTGFQTGSETTEEKVQIAFIFPVLAANVSVSGRVMTANRNGLRNAIVNLTDSNGISRSVRTGSFGYYSFDDVEVGETYIIAVGSKRFVFSPKVIQVNDNIADLDFTAQ